MEDTPKNIFTQEIFENTVCKIKIDDIIDSVRQLCTPQLVEILRPRFEPSPEAPTDRLEDLRTPVCALKGYFSRCNKHPNDAYIVSVERPHLYYINGSCADIISSTRFMHAFFPEFEDRKMAESIVCSKSFRETSHRPSHKYHGCKTADDILAKWEEWRNLGTMLHANIENFMNNDFGDVLHPDNVIPFAQFQDFWSNKDFCRWQTFRTEWAVFDPEIRLAGKIDYVGIRENGKLVIVDWKRVLDIGDRSFAAFRGAPEMGNYVCSDIENCKMITYSLQVNIYKWILEKNYGVRVDSMFLVQFHPKNKNFVLVKCPTMQSYVARMAACRKLALQQ
jgi:hypothetical protein